MTLVDNMSKPLTYYLKQLCLSMISLTKDHFTKIIRNLDLSKTHDHDIIISYIRISSRELIYLNHVLRMANFHQIEKSKRCPTTVDMVKTMCRCFFTSRQLTCKSSIDGGELEY